MSYPNPCDTCTAKHCPTKGYCDAWKIRYLHRQKQINGYARKHGIRPDTEPTESPCTRCRKNENCNQICYPRAKWWDVQMEKVRMKLGAKSV